MMKYINDIALEDIAGGFTPDLRKDVVVRLLAIEEEHGIDIPVV